MFQAYPYVLTPFESGAVMAQCVDVPEGLTQGDDEEAAIHWISDALHVALDGYMEANEDIPPPSKPKPGQRVAYLDPLVAMKLEVYQAMRDKGWSRVRLADEMGTDEKSIRRLLDLDHKSKVEQVVSALRVLGKRLMVDVRDLAAV